MITRIYFRLPNDNCVHYLTSSLPSQPLASLEDVNGRSGYLLAPFATDADSPILLITPEQETTFPTPPLSPLVSVSFEYNEEQSRQSFHTAFARCLEHLSQPSLRKIVLSRTLRLQLSHTLSDQQLEQLFVTAAYRYPQAYVALIQSPEVGTWFIATPELLLEQSDNEYHTMALAATLPLQEGIQLLPHQWSDLHRTEQGIVSEYIEECLRQLQMPYRRSPLQVHTAGEVTHLCRHFHMDASQASLGEILASLHPTPAVCGLPTAQAAKLLAEIEPQGRSYYAGFSGPIGLQAGTHLYVTLRCLSLSAEIATLYAGAGLLENSDFPTEWEETRHKMQTMLSLLSPSSL